MNIKYTEQQITQIVKTLNLIEVKGINNMNAILSIIDVINQGEKEESIAPKEDTIEKQ